MARGVVPTRQFARAYSVSAAIGPQNAPVLTGHAWIGDILDVAVGRRGGPSKRVRQPTRVRRSAMAAPLSDWWPFLRVLRDKAGCCA
jgi:hypothetical protein